MALFSRTLISAASSLARPSRAGDLLLGNPLITSIATDANAVLTVAQLAGGIIQFTGFTAGRTITTPTAALILAAAPDMDIGDSFMVLISCVAAFAGTYVAGTGVTLAGRATTPASSYSLVVVTKTSATTVTWTVL